MIRKLMRSIREYKTPSILSIIFIFFEVVLECALPFITAMLVDQMNDTNGEMIAILSVILVVMAMASLAFGSLAGLFCAKASAGFAKNLRKDMYENITKFSFANIDKFQASSLVTRMTTDVTNVQNAYMQIIRTAIRSPLMLIFSAIMSFVICPELAWIFAVVAPILAFGLILIMIFAMRIFRRIFKEYDALNDSIKENIDGIRVVKSFLREEHEIKKFDKAAGKLRNDFRKAEKIIALNGPLMQFSVHVLMISLLIIGSILIINNSAYLGLNSDGEQVYLFNTVTIGQFQSLITYGFQSLMALMMFSMVIVMIVMAYESSKRIVEVLDEKSSLLNPENPVMEITDGSIKFDNVSFKYSLQAEMYSLKDINLDIKSGMTVGILGSTGSSKTTLVNLISRLYDVTEGAVYVGGVDVRNYDLVKLRDSVSVVLQKNLLFKGTIKDNLRWGKEDATDEEIIHACKLACADEFIESFPKKYDTEITQGGTNVSGGQKQRLCIARALLKHPKVLILDDSTSAVDTKTDSLIRKGFKEYIPETTKIIIAQRIASIQDSDLIIIMDNGRVEATGTHDELLKNDKIYQEIYYSQNRVNGGATNA